MSRIDDALKKLAPSGVQFKMLGDIATLVRGNGMPKIELTEEGVGAIHYGQIYTRYGAWTTTTVSFVTPESAARLATVEPGDIIITNTSENVEDVGKAVAWIGEESIVTGGHATVVKHDQDPKFLSYWFQSESFFAQKKALATGTKVIDVSAKQLAKVRIPLPPREVQHEIVKILDSFIELEKELEKELKKEMEARHVQYAHYRDELLTFLDTPDVRRVPIGEFAELVRGNGMPKADFTEEGVPAIHYGQIYTHYDTWATETKSFVAESTAAKLAKVDKGDVVITNTSENIQDVGKAVAWLGERQAVTGGHATVIKHGENPKYLTYYFQTTEFDAAKRRHATGTKVIDVSAKGLAKIEIPLPPREEQDRLVGILDKLNSVVNDLRCNLPAELNARRLQYAYYRERLLTFEENTA